MQAYVYIVSTRSFLEFVTGELEDVPLLNVAVKRCNSIRCFLLYVVVGVDKLLANRFDYSIDSFDSLLLQKLVQPVILRSKGLRALLEADFLENLPSSMLRVKYRAFDQIKYSLLYLTHNNLLIIICSYRSLHRHSSIDGRRRRRTRRRRRRRRSESQQRSHRHRLPLPPIQ